MKKVTDLELSAEAMLRMGRSAVEAVVNHIINLPEAPRSSLENSLKIVRSLREPSPEKGMNFESLLDFLMNKVIPVSINTPHPAYLGYIPGGGLYPSAVADFLGVPEPGSPLQPRLGWKRMFWNGLLNGWAIHNLPAAY